MYQNKRIWGFKYFVLYHYRFKLLILVVWIGEKGEAFIDVQNQNLYLPEYAFWLTVYTTLGLVYEVLCYFFRYILLKWIWMRMIMLYSSGVRMAGSPGSLRARRWVPYGVWLIVLNGRVYAFRKYRSLPRRTAHWDWAQRISGDREVLHSCWLCRDAGRTNIDVFENGYPNKTK